VPNGQPTWSRRTGAPKASATRRDRSPPVHAGYTRSRQVEECNGHERSPKESRNRRSDRQRSHHQAALQAAGESSSLPPQLPRALRALGHEAVVTEDGASPYGQGGANGASGYRGHPRRPCHPRATTGGQSWYRADNHGHIHSTAELGVTRSCSEERITATRLIRISPRRDRPPCWPRTPSRRCNTEPVTTGGLVSRASGYESPECIADRSNSPPRTPPRNAAHSAGVNISTGPCLFFESRTAIRVSL
jgi:hypothetical protein